MTEVIATNQTILVVGGGISGLTAALEAAETGKQVVLVEKRPFVGGRVTQLYKYFPKICFPTCGLEINQRRAKMNPNLTILTMAEVTDIQGEAGDYTASVRISPALFRVCSFVTVRYSCTSSGNCSIRPIVCSRMLCSCSSSSSRFKYSTSNFIKAFTSSAGRRQFSDENA